MGIEPTTVKIDQVLSYALHAVRASLSYKQEYNLARAEIALITLVDPNMTPMNSYGFQLKSDVFGHIMELSE